MNFNKEELKHIAELSRLKLSEEEENLYGEQLSSILSYVEILNEIDLEKLPGANKGVNKSKNLSLSGGVSDLENIWREDEVKVYPEEEIQETLKQAELEDNFVKVRRVL